MWISQSGIVLICKCFYLESKTKTDFNPLPDRPILGLSNFAPNKGTMSKV